MTFKARLPVAAAACALFALPSTAGAVTFERSDFGAGPEPRSMAVGDFNGDEDPDLAVATNGKFTDRVSVLLGRPGGGFAPATFLEPEFDSLAAVAVGEFNNDGAPDLALPNTDSIGGQLDVLFGVPSGGFGGLQGRGTEGDNPSAVAVGEFDDNGDPDLAITNRGSGTVSAFYGKPGTDFSFPATLFAVGESPVAVAIADFNEDGDSDLAVANRDSAGVSVLLGRAGGDFESRIGLATGDGPASVAAGDFNDDGDPDLAVANRDSDSVSVLLGQAGGTFGPRTDFVAGDGPASVATGDFNSDGDLDLAVANGESHDVSLLLGREGGDFAPKADVATGDGPTAVAVDDFNADGDADLAVATGLSETVSVLLNTSAPTATPSPASLAFAATPVGSTSARQDVTITNNGEASLAISSVALADGDADQFTISAQDCTGRRIRRGESCTVGVRFKPLTEGPASAVLRITDNAPDSPQRVTLTGTGGPPPTPAFTANPSSLAFANQRVGTTSTSRRVTVTNTGTGPLTIASTAVGGDFAITADGCQGRTVGAGANCAVDLAFRPTAAGVRSGSLVLVDNAAGSPHTVGLTGRGCLLATTPLCL